MSDVTAAPSTIERARALFAAEQLPFPPLSERFAAALREENPHLFATRSLEAGPYNLEIYSLEIEQESAVPDYAVVGFDGHGINSWAVHYYVVEGALALFIQLPWAGPTWMPTKAAEPSRLPSPGPASCRPTCGGPASKA